MLMVGIGVATIIVDGKANEGDNYLSHLERETTIYT